MPSPLTARHVGAGPASVRNVETNIHHSSPTRLTYGSLTAAVPVAAGVTTAGAGRLAQRDRELGIEREHTCVLSAPAHVHLLDERAPAEGARGDVGEDPPDAVAVRHDPVVAGLAARDETRPAGPDLLHRTT